MPNSPPSSSRRLDSKADLDARAAIEKQLEEVEAAIAVLQGQDPEQLRRLREARAQAEAEFKEIVARMEAHRARKTRRLARRKRRLVLRVGLGVAAVGVAVVLGKVGMDGRGRWKAVSDALDTLAAPYLSYGMKSPATKRATGNRIELTVPQGSCLIALAATHRGEEAKIRVERGLYTLEGSQSIAWCSCAEENVVVTASSDAADALVGVKLLSAPGPILGGSRALSLLRPAPRSFGPIAQDCEAGHIDGWVKAGRYPKPEVDQSFFDEAGERASLAAAGLQVIARIPAEHPVGGLSASASSCFLAVPESDSDVVSLRAEGGAWPLKTNTGRPLAFCTKEPTTFSLFRDAPGEGPVTVLSAPSARVGGLLGLSEIARRGGLGDALTWASAESLGADAADTLRASGAVDPVIVWPEGAEPQRAIQPRLTALSLIQGGSFLPDPKADAVTSCAPEIAPGSQGQSVCIQSWAQTWRRVGAADKGGMAEAAMPFWLSSWQGVDHPAGLAHAVSLLALARRLHAEGFEPTVLEGVVELKGGIHILGRVGEDAVVAVGVMPRAPWVIPYSEGAPWTLGEDPPVVALPPGDHLLLTSKLANAVPVRERRTIVFRRSVASQEATARADLAR